MSPPAIGGMFGLEGRAFSADVPTPARPAYLRAPHRLLVSARSAFTLLGRQHAPPTVWLPAYLCDVVLPAFPGARRRFFPVRPDLVVPMGGWVDEVAPGDLVVFVTYFGFDTWSPVGEAVRARGAWVVEDGCQALLNERPGPHAHYVVVSPRKFLGVPDGGVLVSNGGPLPDTDDLPPPPAGWWLEALRASRLRAEFDQGVPSREWYALFCRTEPAAPLEPTRMSELSATLLLHGVDHPAMAAARAANFDRLAAALPELAIFRERPQGVYPLGFAMRLANREAVRQQLIAQHIYPPVHWPIAEAVPAEFAWSHQLAGEILMLPSDQRYGPDEMDRLVDAVRRAGAEPVA